VSRLNLSLGTIARAASLALAAVLLAPVALHADALTLRIGDPTANEKLASGIFLSLDESNVKRSLTLAAEKRWGNDYMHARYYSPNLGRFISVDPVGGAVGSSQSWNRYSYVENNPIILIDPDGRMSDATAEYMAGINRPTVFVGDSTPAQRAMTAVCLYPLMATMAVAGVAAVLPEAAVAAIVSAAPEIATGAGVGLATSVAQVSNSNAPIDQKVTAVMAGTALGAATGPLPMTPLKGGAAAVSSSMATDALTGEALMSFQDGGVQLANGAGATIIAAASGAGPLGQIAVAGASKFILDKGASLVITDEPIMTVAD